MRLHRFILLFCLLSISLFILYLIIQQSQMEIKKSVKIFILSSYHRGDICGDMQYRGVKEALNSETVGRLTVEDFWLDTRHLKGKRLKRRIEEAIKRINLFDPYIIITIDDPAFRVALEHFLGREGPPYIVFSGVNRPLKYYNEEYHLFKGSRPAKNVTGVYEYIFSQEAIRFLDEWMDDNSCKLAVVYSNDTVGRILKEQLKEELERTDLKGRIKQFIEVSTLSDLKKTLKTLQEDREVCGYFPFVMSIRDDAHNKQVSFTEVAQYIKKWIKKPDLFPNARGAAQIGLFGGIGVDFQMMGYQAGKMAAKIILGEGIEGIPVERAKEFEVIINYNRTVECGLPPKDDLLNIADEVIVK